jgi:hypothetical protein
VRQEAPRLLHLKAPYNLNALSPGASTFLHFPLSSLCNFNACLLIALLSCLGYGYCLPIRQPMRPLLKRLQTFVRDAFMSSKAALTAIKDSRRASLYFEVKGENSWCPIYEVGTRLFDGKSKVDEEAAGGYWQRGWSYSGMSWPRHGFTKTYVSRGIPSASGMGSPSQSWSKAKLLDTLVNVVIQCETPPDSPKWPDRYVIGIQVSLWITSLMIWTMSCDGWDAFQLSGVGSQILDIL